MTDTQPAEATVTIASQSIELALTGKPDVKNKWGAGSIRPRFVVFTYLPEGIRAHLYGVWVREDGQLTDAPCDQDYRIGDTDEWPDWMAELAREHHPRTAPAVQAAPATDSAALRDAIRRAVCEAEGFAWDSDMLEPDEYGEIADAVLSVLPAPAEEHRVALCDALGLGTGAPWDAICDRATELALPPLSRDPVAQRLGLLPATADRAAVLREAAGKVLEENRRCTVAGLCQPCLTRTAVSDELRRMADEAQQPEAPAVDRLARIREWVTSDVVTAHSEFGSGYREAQRDIRDLLDGRPTESAAAQQPKEEA